MWAETESWMYWFSFHIISNYKTVYNRERMENMKFSIFNYLQNNSSVLHDEKNWNELYGNFLFFFPFGQRASNVSSEIFILWDKQGTGTSPKFFFPIGLNLISYKLSSPFMAKLPASYFLKEISLSLRIPWFFFLVFPNWTSHVNRKRR